MGASNKKSDYRGASTSEPLHRSLYMGASTSEPLHWSLYMGASTLERLHGIIPKHCTTLVLHALVQLSKYLRFA